MDEGPLTPEWLHAFADKHAPEALRPLMLEGARCDVVPGGSGAFGHDPGNPVPVNGIIGEVVYLSRLVTESGERLLFHRIGCVGRVDAYEAVTFSGSEWFLLFLDMYHPAMSRKTPSGFTFSREGALTITGFGGELMRFPSSLGYPGWWDCQDATAYLEPETMRKVLAAGSFVRPKPHRQRLDMLRSELERKDHQRPYRDDAAVHEAERRRRAYGDATREELRELGLPLAVFRDRTGRTIVVKRIDVRDTYHGVLLGTAVVASERLRRCLMEDLVEAYGSWPPIQVVDDPTRPLPGARVSLFLQCAMPMVEGYLSVMRLCFFLRKKEVEISRIVERAAELVDWEAHAEDWEF